jgi:hypothetical protein
MGPEVEAAIIAGGVGVLTVIAAFYGTRKTTGTLGRPRCQRRHAEAHRGLAGRSPNGTLLSATQPFTLRLFS